MGNVCVCCTTDYKSHTRTQQLPLGREICLGTGPHHSDKNGPSLTNISGSMRIKVPIAEHPVSTFVMPVAQCQNQQQSLESARIVNSRAPPMLYE